MQMINIHSVMIAGISNWHIWSMDFTLKRFLRIFQLDTRLLTSKHLKPFST